MTSTSEHTDRHGRCLGPGCTIELDGYFCSARCIESWQERYGSHAKRAARRRDDTG